MINYQRPHSPRREWNQAYYLAHREERLAKSKAWRDANPEKVRAYRQRHRAQYPDRIADGKLRKSKGIDLATYHAMLAAQGGVCAICRQPETTRANTGRLRRFLSVDHDHTTDAVRGLICARCNTGLGAFGDDAERLRAAAEYLVSGQAEAA